MSGKTTNNTGSKGQALVEFALIILILAFLLFVIIEGARILQANLTAQNAARAAGRYAISGQFDPGCLSDTPPCEDPRVESIKAVARQELAGLPLAEGAAYEDANYYLVEVIGTDENGNQIPDYAGAPGMPVMVRVTYRVGMVTPLTRPIAETVRVIGQVVLNNELFTQISDSRTEAPQLTPYPTPGASPTPIPPDLQLTKSDSLSPGPAIVEEPFSYIITIVNLGLEDAADATLVDELPDGIDYISGPAGCTEVDGVVTCTGIDVAANGSKNISLLVVARPEIADATVTNRASINYPGDQNPGNDSDDHDTPIVGPPSEADVALAKSASPLIVAVGGDLIYTIGVVNNGLAQATNVTVVDTLPGNVTFVSATPSQGSCDPPAGDDVTCNLGTLARNASATITIRVQPTQEGNITNTAEVAADEIDPDGSNNNDSVTVEVRDAADLSVTKMASGNPVPVAGEEMIYTVSVVNNGPADATGVQMQDSLPSSVSVVQINTSQGSCSEAGNVVDCNLGNIAAGAGATVTIVVMPSEDGSITNLASVSGDQADPYSPNNDFELNTTVQPRADLELTKTGDDSVEAGDILTYVILVTNHGPSTAEGVLVSDTLPPDVTFMSASANPGTCSGNNATVTCNLDQIPAGATSEITIRVIPGVPGTILNKASVDSLTVDPDTGNNNDEHPTTVTGSQAYIILDKLCGAPGEAIVVKGYDWSTSQSSQYDLYLDWIHNGTGQVVSLAQFDNPEDWQRTIQIPGNTQPGIHEIRAHRTRPQGQGTSTQAEDIAEVQVPCPAPNLIISTPQLVSGTPVRVGQPVTFTAQVSNIGDLDAVSQFFAGLYFDPSPAPNANSTHINQSFRQAIVALNGLAAGASKTVTFFVEPGFDSTGTHKVYGVADSDPAPEGVIGGEHDETDNISSPRQVTVSSPPTPTATPSATPGPAPTATATPTPGPTAVPGSLIVSVHNDEGQPQANAEISVIDEDSGEVVAVGYGDVNGTHLFQNLPPATYTVTACIVIENEDYYAFVTGVVVQPGAIAQRILFLQPAPGGCT